LELYDRSKSVKLFLRGPLVAQPILAMLFDLFLNHQPVGASK